MRNNPGRPAPCSAKAAYKLADSKSVYLIALISYNAGVGLDLRELKERAAQVFPFA